MKNDRYGYGSSNSSVVRTICKNGTDNILVIVIIPHPLVCLENVFPYFSSHFNLTLSGKSFLFHPNSFYSLI